MKLIVIDGLDGSGKGTQGEKLCSIAEDEGYSNDICAYARISLAYAKTKDAPEQEMPLPDYLLCCNTICNFRRCFCSDFRNILNLISNIFRK